ncbi:MAG: hypothetical protein QOD78_1461 [Chloroflexota bacterium]|jgi:hypothetical protein|nr:hypothetical protein [Chloroflexota bacterium]
MARSRAFLFTLVSTVVPLILILDIAGRRWV